MNKIALRIGPSGQHWNHIYYQNLFYLDPRYPLPFWNYIKQDHYIQRIVKGFYPLSKIEIHKTREVIDIYICKNRYVNYLSPISDQPKVKFMLDRGAYLNEVTRNSKYQPVINDSLNYNRSEKNSVSSILRNSSYNFTPVASSKNENSRSLAPLRALLNILKTRIQIFNLYTFPIHDADLLVGYLLRDHKVRLNAFKRLWKLGIIKGIKIKIQGRYKKSTRTQNEVYQFGQIPNTPTTKLNIRLFYASRVLLQSLGTSSLHIHVVYAKSGKRKSRV